MRPEPGTPFLREFNASYPVHSSFVMPDNQLAPPQSFLIEGITFMFSEDSLERDRVKLKNNYAYRLWIAQKWFHEGPMRSFPLVVRMDWPSVQTPDLELPWIDRWDPALELPALCPLGVSIEGTPFVPAADLDVILGIRGHLTRAVQ